MKSRFKEIEDYSFKQGQLQERKRILEIINKHENCTIYHKSMSSYKNYKTSCLSVIKQEIEKTEGKE